mgnify:CR=1 FL=1
MGDSSKPDQKTKPRRLWRKLVGFSLLGIAVLLVLIQLVPFGRDHSQPAVTKAAFFADPRARQIADDSCNDCHSNLTRWPWYTNVAPASWLVQQDVDEGRAGMNLSEWDKPQPSLDRVIEHIESGEMPPLKYKVMPNHAAARLSEADREILVGAFRVLYARQPPEAIKASDPDDD